MKIECQIEDSRLVLVAWLLWLFLNEEIDFHAQFDGTILSIKYSPNEAMPAIRKRIFQELSIEFKQITHVKINRLFYQINLTFNFKSLSKSTFNFCEINILDRLMGAYACIKSCQMIFTKFAILVKKFFEHFQVELFQLILNPLQQKICVISGN